MASAPSLLVSGSRLQQFPEGRRSPQEGGRRERGGPPSMHLCFLMCTKTPRRRVSPAFLPRPPPAADEQTDRGGPGTRTTCSNPRGGPSQQKRVLSSFPARGPWVSEGPGAKTL